MSHPELIISPGQVIVNCSFINGIVLFDGLAPILCIQHILIFRLVYQQWQDSCLARIRACVSAVLKIQIHSSILGLRHDYLWSDGSTWFWFLWNLVFFNLISLELQCLGCRKVLVLHCIFKCSWSYILFKVVQKYTQEKYACL